MNPQTLARLLWHGTALLVADLLPLVQAAQPGGLDGGDVDERVARTIFIGNETIAFVAVEEFYGADRHAVVPFTEAELPPIYIGGARKREEGRSCQCGNKIRRKRR